MGTVLMLGEAVNSQEKPQPRLLTQIIDVQLAVREKAPPELVVSVRAQTPTPEYTNVRLLRAAYKTPPEDGIQDYFLLATPPDGIVTQVLSRTAAQDVWSDFPKWLKGVRVHGVGDGVKVQRLP
jgi:hypothetical protein